MMPVVTPTVVPTLAVGLLNSHTEYDWEEDPLAAVQCCKPIVKLAVTTIAAWCDTKEKVKDVGSCSIIPIFSQSMASQH